MNRAPPPLDLARLNEMALAYAARFATSAGKLSTYLKRKVRERGWAGEDDALAAVSAVVGRMVELRYVDDEAFAQARSSGLLRRGYGARRIDETLRAAGVSEQVRGDARGSERERREAALTMARKRRFGPFGNRASDPATRQKQVAAMLRAGHPLASARELVDAASIGAAEAWAGECEDD